jgi:tRNA-2-methylthio-N6-dimethylallyladenosine synthase
MDGSDGARSAHIITYGCQMNAHDSDVMMRTLEGLGYRSAARAEDADLILVNTCCVRDSAEQHAFGKLGELKRVKEARPGTLLGVMGCLPQEPEAVGRLMRLAPHLDLILGTNQMGDVGEILAEAESATATVVHVTEDWFTPDAPPAPRSAPLKAYVNISFGCDNWCSFCIVPHTRGPERSRPLEAIVAEVRGLVERGTREVTLLGQNVNSYGRNLADPIAFEDLLAALDEVDGLWRIRYTSPHPADFTPALVRQIARSRAVCPQFHMPAQSGSDSVLGRMERGYTRERYLGIVDAIRSEVPAAAISTDLIVGFPGESEAEFEDTLELCERVGFDRAHTFMYSPRQGTRAALMPDQVSLFVKRQRLHRLNQVTDASSLQNNRSEVGEVREVLVEGPSKKDPSRLSGRTPQNRIVVFEGGAALVGRRVPVRIVGANTWTLFGEPLGA